MKTTYHHKNLKQTLLKASINVIKKEDIKALSLRKIATQAGVSHNAPYRHFKNKEDLLCALAEFGFTELSKSFQQALKKPSKQFLALGKAYVAFAIKNPELFKLMFGGVIPRDKRTESLATTSKKTFEQLIHVISQEQPSSSLEHNEQIGLAAWSMVHGLSALLLSGSIDEAANKNYEMLTKQVCEVLGRGLAN